MSSLSQDYVKNFLTKSKKLLTILSMENLTIQSLKDKGFKVKVNYLRYSNLDARSPRRKSLIHRHLFLDGRQISPKGGMTIVEITSPKGETSLFKIKCSFSDVFDKKVGVKLALDKYLEKQSVV